MPPSLSPPPPPKPLGYGCKAWMAREIEERYLGGTHYVWSSRELNPIQNGDSSNPLWLYWTIDRAVKLGDVNHPKIRALRRTLLRVVTGRIGPAQPGIARELRQQIRHAPLDQFRPQLWRIDLSRIAPRRVQTSGANPHWDEQHIDDLHTDEFEVIVY